MPQAVSLTDSQIESLMRASQPLHPTDRDNFLRELATLLQGRCELLFRLLAQIQRKFFKPPVVVQRTPRPERRQSSKLVSSEAIE